MDQEQPSPIPPPVLDGQVTTIEPQPPAKKLSASMSRVICKGILSSPARFAGMYEDESFLLTHAWPSMSDQATWASKTGPHSETSRHHYVLAFEAPPQRIAPGVPLADWSWVVEAATVALAVYFGKQFDSGGLIEGGGMFHVPQTSTSSTPYPHFPPYDDDPRVDLAGDLNFARCDWLPRWLTSGNNDAMTAVARAGTYYLRALRTFGHDATSAYVDLVMAGEILSDRHVLPDAELYDAELRAVLDRISAEDAALIKQRLFQVRRKFAGGLRSYLNEGFFARTETKGPFAERIRLSASDVERRLKAAYDVRSTYVHTGRSLGGHPHSMQGFRNEVQLGKPLTGSEKLDKALALAPTFLGLERIIRFSMLRVAHKEIGLGHSDLDDDKVPGSGASPPDGLPPSGPLGEEPVSNER